VKTNTSLKSKLIGYLSVTPIHFLTMMVLIATLFIPKPVIINSQEEMKSISLGYPLGFYIQNFSRYSPLIFPYEHSFSFGSPWEDPAKIHIPYFLLSYLIVYALLLLIYRWIRSF